MKHARPRRQRISDAWIGLAMVLVAAAGGFCAGWLAHTIVFWFSR